MPDDDLVFNNAPGAIPGTARWHRQRRRRLQHEFLEPVPQRTRKKKRKRKRKRKHRSPNVYLYDHPWNRYREKIDPPSTEHLGKKYFEYQGSLPNLVGDFGEVITFPSVEKTADVLHQKIRGKYRTGGHFRSVKCHIPEPQVQNIGRYEGNDFRPFGALEVYQGGFAPANWGHGYSIPDFKLANTNDSPINSIYGDSSPFGASAWNKFKPDPFGGNYLGQALYEGGDNPETMRKTAEGFHTVWKGLGGHPTRFAPRDVADHFLNTQFGWIPFISDLRDLYNHHQNLNNTLQDAISKNGKWQDRGGVLYNNSNVGDSTVVENYAGVVTPALSSGFYDSSKYAAGVPVRSVLSRVTTDKVWFKGRFRYWIPSLAKDHDPLNHAVNLVRAYGLNLSPTLVWQVTPWSWLADWYSNAGKVIDNISTMSTDNIVAQSAFVMRKTEVRVMNESTIHLKNGPVHCSWSQVIDSKVRTEANPFGFSTEAQELSLRQQLILVSLGITRIF